MASDLSPSSHGVVVVPSDTVSFAAGVTTGIYVGVTGNVVVVFDGGAKATFVAVPAGAILPVRAMRVDATSTTATTMIALYSQV